MSSIIAYAGLRAKLAAMASRFLTKDDYAALMSKSSVPEITAYLQQTKMYSRPLKDVNADELHRRDLETLLKKDLVEDVRKIFTFFVTVDRVFSLYILRMYEVENLKLALRNALVEKEFRKNIEELKNKFYDLGTRALIDPVKVASATTREEILNALEKTPYHEVIRNAFESYKGEAPNLIGSIENGLDRWWFFGILKSAQDLDYDDFFTVKEIMGERADLTNIEWILRAKAFYSLSDEELYNSLIPIGFKMEKDDYHRLCGARSFDEALGFLSEGTYKELFKPLYEEHETTPEMATHEMRKHLYRKYKSAVSVMGGFSIAPFFHYLFLKEYEIMDIVTIIEGVRYDIDAKEIAKHLIASF